MRNIVSFVSGLLFGLGLLASGMTNPAKVQGFLDVFGHWDPSLGLVMAGAIAVTVMGYALARKRGLAWTGDRIDWPSLSTIDARLIGGGVLFGIGWAIAGFCPGPALVAMGAGLWQAWLFGAAMVAGMLLHEQFSPNSSSRPSHGAQGHHSENRS
jgi:uncharacterized protein